ncbi:MAG: GNAT family N-acetyltransferase [Chloroflexi bacterium]|nr:GNAT family N-acetyltransferase [Chloroflexota bacterium]MBP8055919.1 GNAT family N-acetyltransferase [Chloroflexota bacterium]
MSIIRPLHESEFDALVDIMATAYPSMKLVTPEDKQRTKERFLTTNQESTINFYGLFRDETLVGAMRLHDFTMQLFETRTLAGGVGMVGTHFLHKKEKVAKEMISYFHQHYRERGAAITTLYPFRPDFYNQMGYGYGGKMWQYRFSPASLPGGTEKSHIDYLSVRDKEAVLACFDRYMSRTHGVMAKATYEVRRLLENPAMRIVGYREGEQVLGYVAFTFQPVPGGNFLQNELQIEELVYDSPQVLWELCAFLRSQADQIGTIVYTSPDPNWHFLLSDPRNGSGRILPSVCHENAAQGLGAMVRVIHARRLFTLLPDHDFGGQTVRLTLSLRDTFLPENDGAFVVHFDRGRAQISPDDRTDVTVRLDVANFSSLVLGAITFQELMHYGLAEISHTQYVPTVHRLFFSDSQPVCLSLF